ncbi:hypothetical protein EC844_12155 [Acinetobacter calcoaceticus]|uniref:Uncharacterized protein n=1 Tax=Acinetobacter calcoaceticus TaxID=471 RepID=A0A4R1XM66_ACICA|nr:hypothetical protein EC844_12155 [Acinetobacter calcoaceticus]
MKTKSKSKLALLCGGVLSAMLSVVLSSTSFAKPIAREASAAAEAEVSAYAVMDAAEDAAQNTEVGSLSACDDSGSCTVVAASCDDSPHAAACNAGADYGGIKQQYVVKGCKVTIYNDGPVRMVDEKTDQFCDAPLPKDHVFSKKLRSYQQNGCIVTEYASGDASMDCTKRDRASQEKKRK